MPVVEAVDPIVLNLRLTDPGECPPLCPPPCSPCQTCGCAGGEGEPTEIPLYIGACFDCELTFEACPRRLYVTLGQFSIIRLERDSQLLIPMYEYCMPTRECTGCGEETCEDDPCEIFRQIRFPVGEFFPPNTLPGMPEERNREGESCGS